LSAQEVSTVSEGGSAYPISKKCQTARRSRIIRTSKTKCAQRRPTSSFKDAFIL